MSVFYSILSAAIRPEIQEKISVGIFVLQNETIEFKYSKEKLSIAKELLNDNSFYLLREIVRNIDRSTNFNKLARFENETLFDVHKKNLISVGFLEYLSKFSTNIISISSPKFIEIKTKSNIEILFKKYIDDNERNKVIVPKKPFQIIREKYKEKIDNFFDVSTQLTSAVVPNLISPITIDFSGRNGIDVFVQTLDLSQQPHYISNHINSLFQLKSIYQANNKSIKDFIVAQEPSKKLSVQHQIWNHIKNQKILNYIDMSESDKIIEYAERNNVRPLTKTS